MKILVNATNLVIGGGIQVARSLLVELSHNPLGHTFRAVVSPQVANVLPSDVDITILSPSPARPWSGRATRRKLAEIEKEYKPNVVLTIFGPAYWRPRSFHVCGFANAWTFTANTWAWRTLTWQQKPRSFIESFVRRTVWKHEDADLLIVETAALRESLLHVWPDKRIVVINNNCGQSFFELQNSQKDNGAHILPQKEPGEFRIVTLTQYYRHKNLEIIPAVARILKDTRQDVKFRFYLSLNKDSVGWKKIYMLARKTGVEECLRTIGVVSPSQAPLFYEDADILFLPSVLECFSANYPEAMIMKVPIVTTDLPFAHSVCQDAALYFQPMDAHSAALKILPLISDKTLSKELVSNGLRALQTLPNPAKKAELYIKTCEEVLTTDGGDGIKNHKIAKRFSLCLML